MKIIQDGFKKTKFLPPIIALTELMLWHHGNYIVFRKINNYNVYITLFIALSTVILFLTFLFIIVEISFAILFGLKSTLSLVIFINTVILGTLYIIILILTMIPMIKVQMGKSFLINIDENAQKIKL